MKPKVLLLGHLPPSAGGITSLLLTILASGTIQDYELIPFNIGRPAKRNVVHNYGYHALLNSGLKRGIIAVAITLWHLGIFPIVVFWHRPAIIHIHSAPFLVFWETAYYVFIARILRIPCCLQFHSSLRHFYEMSGPTLRTAIFHVISMAKAFVVVCREDMGLVAEKAGDNTRCFYLPNFIDVGTFQRSITRARGQVQPERNIAILFLGGSDAVHKGLNDLLSVVRLLGRSQLGLHFLLVAVPKEKVEPELPADLLPCCSILDWVSGNAKLEVFAKTDLFVLPSIAEGMPMGILEAMASSIPVVATKVGGIPDMITDGQEGYQLNPGDVEGLVKAISHLAQDPDKRKKMGEKGLQKALSLYDIPIGTQQLENLYKEILQYPSCKAKPGANPRCFLTRILFLLCCCSCDF